MRRGLLFGFVVILFFSLAYAKSEEGLTALVPICQIQGSTWSSPKWNQVVRTQGVVTADFDAASQKGFYIQAENCDANPATSDGVFVYLGERLDVVRIGDWVEVSGTVVENYGLTQINVSPSAVLVLAQAQPLPAPVELYPPFNNEQARIYFETVEAMLVSVAAARVVGPTDSREDTWVIRNDLGLDRVFQGDDAGTGEIICLGSEGDFELAPAKVGDQVFGARGVMGFSLGTYRIALLTAPAQIPAGSSFGGVESSPKLGFTFGTFNLENLFDVVDDPTKDDVVLSLAEYQRKLDKLALVLHTGLGEPAFLAVQEAENETVLRHLAARLVIEADYDVIWLDGPDTRGIDVALMYRTDALTVWDYAQRQGCTTLIDGLGPDGNRDVQNPANEITCDINGDGVLDGNRLFSRPPLVVHLEAALGEGETLPLWVLVNHFKSKREDSSTQAYTLPRRVEQARFVAGLVTEIEAAHPGAAVMVLGDLNDFPDSQPLAILRQARLLNTLEAALRPTRYTYIYQGVSQVLDYILVNPVLAVNRVQAQPVHVNADYPVFYEGQAGVIFRASDHEPVLVHFEIFPNRVYLPRVSR